MLMYVIDFVSVYAMFRLDFAAVSYFVFHFIIDNIVPHIKTGKCTSQLCYRGQKEITTAKNVKHIMFIYSKTKQFLDFWGRNRVLRLIFILFTFIFTCFVYRFFAFRIYCDVCLPTSHITLVLNICPRNIYTVCLSQF